MLSAFVGALHRLEDAARSAATCSCDYEGLLVNGIDVAAFLAIDGLLIASLCS